MADTGDLKSPALTGVRVRVPPSARLLFSQDNIQTPKGKSRGNYAYTLLDISHPMPHDTVERLKEIDGVVRVRRIVENK